MTSEAIASLRYCDATKIAVQSKTDLRKEYTARANWNCRYLWDQDLYLVTCRDSTQKAEMVSLALQLLDIKVSQDVIDKLAEDLPPVPSAMAFPPTAAPTVTEFVPTLPNPADTWSNVKLPAAAPAAPPPRQARRVWRPPDDSGGLFVDRAGHHWEVRGPPAEVAMLRERIFRRLRDTAGADINPGETEIRFGLRP
jgi:hypothetical protein